MSSDKRCLKCKYNKKALISKITDIHTQSKISGLENHYCDYICMMNKRRPCEPGKACTVFEPKRRGRKKSESKRISTSA